MNSTLLEKVSAELRRLGLELQEAPGQYRVNFRNGTRATEYQTDDLAEALQQGRIMASHPPELPEPPLGPQGPRSPGRAVMYAHNRRDAARRRKRKMQGQG